VLDAVEDAGRTLAAILLTHSHPDHAAGAPMLAKLSGAPTYAFDPAYGRPLPPRVEVDGLVLNILPTPGHSADSVCVVIEAESTALTGDHVLGRGTTVVEHPGGRMGDYLESLESLRALKPLRLLPGHGPVVESADAVLEQYLRHRYERLDQIVSAVDAGAGTLDQLLDVIYSEAPAQLRPVAALSLQAGLELLVDRGTLTRIDGRYRGRRGN
jgi:glyoxylase-like metal-dependent hydrolase (beta-lactamase superfamily II)